MTEYAGRSYAVVGGGVAGLLAAIEAAERGARVTLFEGADELGGRVAAQVVDGLELDAGAESFATRGGSVERLVRELGLGADIVSPEPLPAWIVTPERSYALPKTAWLGIPVNPLEADVRRAIGWRGAVRALADRWRPVTSAESPEARATTLGALVRDRLGDAVADNLVGPIASGVFSRPIDELSVDAAAPGILDQMRDVGGLSRAAAARRAAAPAGSAVLGLRGGVHRLVAALAGRARAAGVEIVVGATVAGLTRAGGGWRVSFAAGRGPVAPIDADHVVVATSRNRALPLISARDWHRVAPAGRVTLVTLVLEPGALGGAPRGTGALAAGGVTEAKAITHATAKWAWLREAAGGREVVRLSYAGEGDFAGAAVADAARLLGVGLVEAEVRALAQVEWEDSSPAAAVDEPLPAGLTVVGSAAGLSGLAAIVGQSSLAPAK